MIEAAHPAGRAAARRGSSGDRRPPRSWGWLGRALAGGFIFAFLALLLAHAAPAEPARSDHVETELHASRSAVAPGETFTIALRQTMANEWHTYWRNPGDSGEPTEIIWTGRPAGFEIGELQWPTPIRLPADASIMQFAYGGEVLFPIEVKVPETARAGEDAVFNADVTWLECADVCIPASASLRLTVPVAAEGADDPVWGPRIAAAVAALPRTDETLAARITAQSGGGLLSIAGPAVALGPSRIRSAHFYPYRQDAVLHSAPEEVGVGAEGLSFMLQPGFADDLGQGPLEGVVAFQARGSDGWTQQAFVVRAAPGEPLPGTEGAAPARAAQSGAMTLPLAILFGFIGGLILNVMPCVFPVLSLKALSLAQNGAAADARRSGVLFTAGVLSTFLVLAGVLIALKAGGAAVGWGFQLQEPLVVAALATLFFAIGLNLAGVFSLGGGLQNLGAGLAGRGGDAGAFFTGALAVVAATPCTAPFMASATGFAATQGALTTLLVFLFLGLGFAAPFAALAFFPQLRSWLPKPGPWMERAKIVLAFPMFAACAWLAWVLAAQTGPNGLLALLAVLTALAFFVVVGRWGARWRIAGVAAVLIVALLSWRPLTTPAEASTAAAEAQAWSPARVTQLVNEGRGVFVDFTATWCVTCQVNKATTLNSARVRRAFADNDIVFLEADWTNKNAEIAAALAEHGRDGVPLYLYYAPGAASPLVLPQVLTEQIVLNAIAEDGGRR